MYIFLGRGSACMIIYTVPLLKIGASFTQTSWSPNISLWVVKDSWKFAQMRLNEKMKVSKKYNRNLNCLQAAKTQGIVIPYGLLQNTAWNEANRPLSYLFTYSNEGTADILWCKWPYVSIRGAGIILSMGSANERRRYYVTTSLTGWTHTQNDPWGDYYTGESSPPRSTPPWQPHHWQILTSIISTAL